MRTIVSKTILMMALACAPAMLMAQQSQTPSVEYGRTTVTLTSDFVNSIQGVGAVITDLQKNPLQNSSFTVKAVAGSVDLSNSAGEVEHTGGLLVNAAGQTIRIQNLIIDTSNPTAPVITAAFINGDHFAGRMALFNITPPAGFSLPLVPQSGVLQENGLSLSLAPAAASALSSLFGTSVPTGTVIATANVYVVLAPQN